jgi:hypothetical protein
MPLYLLPLPLPFLLPATHVTIAVAHIIAVAVAIAIVAVARLPPSLPLILPPSPFPSLLDATLVADTITLFVTHHPYCRHHYLEALALFIAALIIRCMLLSLIVAFCHGHLVLVALLPATACL